jgi:hypothetical protein
MATKTDELRELFSRLTTETTFTEHQQRDDHAIPTDRGLDTALQRVVAEMRAEYGFRTSLDDDQLAAVVRGFYTGASDAEIAADVGVSAAVVARARIHLQLLREADAGEIDLRALDRLLDAGHSIEACARELDASEAVVDRARQVLDARHEAQRHGYHYQLAFESLLDDAGLTTDVSESRRQDRDAFVDVFD